MTHPQDLREAVARVARGLDEAPFQARLIYSGNGIESADLRLILSALTALQGERDEAREIVSRIWSLFGNPSYADLKGRSIYDLIAGVQRQARHNREAWGKAEAQLSALKAENERLSKPITMQDVRLAVGEGKLTPQDVIAGCNAELRRRASLYSPPKEAGDGSETIERQEQSSRVAPSPVKDGEDGA